VIRHFGASDHRRPPARDNSGALCRGLGEEGVQELRDFATDGGTVIAFNNASMFRRHQSAAGGEFAGRLRADQSSAPAAW